MQLVLDDCRFQWTFLLATVQCPIISVDFLRAHQLLVDPFNNRLLDLSSLRFLKADTDKPHPGSPGISTVDKTEGGGARLLSAQSTPPGSSSPLLPHLVWRRWHNCFRSFRMSSIPPSSFQQLSMMFFTTSRQWVLL